MQNKLPDKMCLTNWALDASWIGVVRLAGGGGGERASPLPGDQSLRSRGIKLERPTGGQAAQVSPASVHVFCSGAFLLASAGLMEIDLLVVYSVQLWAGCEGVVED